MALRGPRWCRKKEVLLSMFCLPWQTGSKRQAWCMAVLTGLPSSPDGEGGLGPFKALFCVLLSSWSHLKTIVREVSAAFAQQEGSRADRPPRCCSMPAAPPRAEVVGRGAPSPTTGNPHNISQGLWGASGISCIGHPNAYTALGSFVHYTDREENFAVSGTSCICHAVALGEAINSAILSVTLLGYSKAFECEKRGFNAP